MRILIKHVMLGFMAWVFCINHAVAQQDAVEENNAEARGEITSTLTFASDYIYRGVSLTDGGPSVQGSFDYGYTINDQWGLYAGIWGGSEDIDGSLEVDYYGGATYTRDNWSLDTSLLYYTYPGAPSDFEYNYGEAQAILGYDFGHFTLSGQVNYSPRNFGDSGEAWYTAALVEVPLPKDFTLSSHFGRQKIQDADTYGMPSYNEWSLEISRTFASFDVTLQYVDSNIDEDICTSLCGKRVAVSVARTF